MNLQAVGVANEWTPAQRNQQLISAMLQYGYVVPDQTGQGDEAYITTLRNSLKTQLSSRGLAMPAKATTMNGTVYTKALIQYIQRGGVNTGTAIKPLPNLSPMPPIQDTSSGGGLPVSQGGTIPDQYSSPANPAPVSFWDNLLSVVTTPPASNTGLTNAIAPPAESSETSALALSTGAKMAIFGGIGLIIWLIMRKKKSNKKG